MATVEASGPVLVTLRYAYLLTFVLTSDPPAIVEGLSVSVSWLQNFGLKTELVVQMFAVVEEGEETTTAR